MMYNQRINACKVKERKESIDNMDGIIEEDDEKIQISKKEYDKLKQNSSELKKYKKVIDCIKGNNGGKCIISDFLPIDIIPEDIKSELVSISHKINEKFPVELEIPYKNGESCNNQSLGNQIPMKFKEYISKREEQENKRKEAENKMKVKAKGKEKEKGKRNRKGNQRKKK